MHSFRLSIVICALVAGRGYGEWIWTTLPDYPGALSTLPNHMSGNRFVGQYKDQTGAWHGYCYDGETWATVDYPGSTFSMVEGIDGDNMVGTYQIGMAWGAFLYDGTSWTKLEYEGASVRPFGIEGNSIVGTLDKTAFHYDGTTWTRLVYPGATYTALYDISGDRMVGVYNDGTNTFRGCLYDGASWAAWTPLEYPGSTYTSARSIDGPNIVGTFILDGFEHGFLFDGMTWTSFMYPGAFGTRAYAIEGNRILGTYVDAGNRNRSFILTLPEPSTLFLLVASAFAVGARCRRIRHGSVVAFEN